MSLANSLIWQTSVSTGTGNLTLVHKSGYRDFNVFGTGATPNVFYYFIEDVTNDAWEIGTGHMSASQTLVRDTVLESSNANAAVNFLGGTLQVVNDIRAANQPDITQPQTWTAAQTFPAASIASSVLSGTGAARSVGIVITGGTAVVPTGTATAQVVVPFTGTITKWYAAADQSGSIVVDVLRSGTSIVGGSGNKPTLSSAQSANAAPTSWTSTAVMQGDILTFSVSSSTTVTSINITLLCTVT